MCTVKMQSVYSLRSKINKKVKKRICFYLIRNKPKKRAVFLSRSTNGEETLVASLNAFSLDPLDPNTGFESDSGSQ